MPFEYKTKQTRLQEVIKVLTQIRTFGFPNENQGIKDLRKILSKWVKDGQYKKGKIKLIGFERIIQYELYIRKETEIAVNLKFIKGL